MAIFTIKTQAMTKKKTGPHGSIDFLDKVYSVKATARRPPALDPVKNKSTEVTLETTRALQDQITFLATQLAQTKIRVSNLEVKMDGTKATQYITSDDYDPIRGKQ